MERFWEKVDRSGDCWPWTASTNNAGYGRCGRNPRGEYLAHRMAWTLTHGPIPPGLCVLHRCDNPPCCNPAHLFLGTRADNVADMVAKGRAVQPRALQTHCKLGHTFSPANTRVNRAGHRNCRECVRRLDRERGVRDRDKRRAAHRIYMKRRRAAGRVS